VWLVKLYGKVIYGHYVKIKEESLMHCKSRLDMKDETNCGFEDFKVKSWRIEWSGRGHEVQTDSKMLEELCKKELYGTMKKGAEDRILWKCWMLRTCQ